MKKYAQCLNILIIISMLMSGSFIAKAADNEYNIYVDCNASSEGNGELASPFSSIEAARDYLREQKNNGNFSEMTININLRDGTYNLDSSFILLKEDSGTSENPIVYKNYANENVELTFNKKLNITDAKITDDEEILSKIPDSAQGKIVEIDLKSYGITDFGTYPRRNYNNSYGSDDFSAGEFFIDGKAQTFARYPNGNSYIKTGEIVKKGATGANSVSRESESWIFKCDSERLERWKNAENAYIWGFLANDYGFCNAKIKNIDTDNKTVETSYGLVYGISENKDFYIANLIEELDFPGEYYVDTESGILYFYPPYDLTSSELVFTDVYDSVIKMENTSYVTVEGIKISGSKTCGIEMTDAVNCEIKDCEITNTGFYGVNMTRCLNSGVNGGSIHDVGARAVQINDSGDRENLVSSDCYVKNCDIYSWSRIAVVINAIQALRSVGVNISNNCLHDAPMAAIHLQNSNNCTIEYNEIYDVLQQTNDNGAIYTGQLWDCGGHVIQNNLIHDIKVNRGSNTTHAFGVYFDDTYSGGSILNNVFHKVATPLIIGGGSDNKVVGNIAVDCPNSFIMDSRGYDGIAQNRVAYPDGASYKSLMSMPYESEIWKKEYPYLEYYFTDEFRGKGIPARNYFKSNYFLGTDNPVTLADIAVEYGYFADNYYDDKEFEFKDKEKLDFTLSADSEFYTLCPEAEQWDVSKAGTDSESLKQNDIKLMTPFHKSIKNNSEEIIFSWIDTGYTGPYKLKVASDKEMKNIVYEEECYTDSIAVNSLDGGKNHYWWTVEPVYQGQEQLLSNKAYKTEIFEFGTEKIEAVYSDGYNWYQGTSWQTEGVLSSDEVAVDGNSLNVKRSESSGIRTFSKNWYNVYIDKTDVLKMTFSAYFGPFPLGGKSDEGNEQRFITPVSADGSYLFKGGAYCTSSETQVFSFASLPDYKRATENSDFSGSDANFLKYGNENWFDYSESMWHSFEYYIDLNSRMLTVTVDGNKLMNRYGRDTYYVKDDFYGSVTDGLGFITKLSGAIEDTQEFRIKDLKLGIKAEEKTEELTAGYGYLLKEDFSEIYSSENTEWNIAFGGGDSVYIASDEGGSYISVYRDKEKGIRKLERIFDEVDIKTDDKLKLKFDAYFGKYPQGVSTPDGNKFLGIKAINKTDNSISYLYDGNTYNKVGYFASAPDYNTWVSLGKPDGYTQGSRVEFVNYDWFDYSEPMWHSFEYNFDFENRCYTITVDGNEVSNLSYGGTKFLIKDDFYEDIAMGANLGFIWSSNGEITDTETATQEIRVRNFEFSKYLENEPAAELFFENNSYKARVSLIGKNDSENVLIIIAKYDENRLSDVVIENIGAVKKGYIKEYTTKGSVEINENYTYKAMLWEDMKPLTN